MSMKLMVDAMNIKVGNAARKLVLIKLADNANDKGECFPSYQHIADACEMSRRSVINHIDALIKMGLVEKVERKQRSEKGVFNQSNVYTLNLSGGKKPVEKGGENSALGGSENHAEGGENSALGSERAALGGSENSAPITSHSIEPVNEPIKNKQKNSTKKLSEPENLIEAYPVFGLVERQVLDDWIEYQKSNRASFSKTALSEIDKQLGYLGEAGINPTDSLTSQIARGWKTIQAGWVVSHLADFNGAASSELNRTNNNKYANEYDRRRGESFRGKHTDRSWAN